MRGRTGSATRSPLRTFALLLAAAVLLSAGSWLIGVRVADGDSGPELVVPQASLVTAKVSRQTVVTALHGRATIDDAESTSVAGPAKGGRVTRTPLAAGDEVTERSVLIEVDGRPTLALIGDVPMYRALYLGTEGPDVLALENSLTRAGIDPGLVDGKFDAATETAVRALFRTAGYEPVEPTAEQRSAYSAAVEAATQSRLAVLEAQHQLELDVRGPDAGDRAALLQAIATADREVDRAGRAAAALGPQLDAAIEAVGVTVTDTADQLAALQRQLDALPAADPTRSTLELSRSQTQALLTQARTTLDTLDRDRPNELADALDAVVDAQTAASVARTKLTTATTSEDRDLLTQRLAIAQESSVAAEQRAADQAAIVGAGLQVSEVIFFPTLPRRVGRVDAETGAPASGELMEVTGGNPVATWFVEPDERAQLVVGGAVTLTNSITGDTMTGTIAEIATSPGDADRGTSTASESSTSAPGSDATGAPGVGKYRVIVHIEPTDGAAPRRDLVGSDVLVTAPISESGPGLAVPVAAVSSRSDGTVVVRKASGRFDSVEVPVTVGAKGDGLVQVVPTGDALAEGDRVVVGA